MEPPANRKPRVAIDLGAQSCRVALLRWDRGEPVIEIVHRFANEPRPIGNELRWDIHAVFEGIKTGLHRCCDRSPEGIASVGVDGWAVDYVRLDGAGNPIALPFWRLDSRTAEVWDFPPRLGAHSRPPNHRRQRMQFPPAICRSTGAVRS